jgi:hypothetical protein
MARPLNQGQPTRCRRGSAEQMFGEQQQIPPPPLVKRLNGGVADAIDLCDALSSFSP